jgi:hypothetical protein
VNNSPSETITKEWKAPVHIMRWFFLTFVKGVLPDELGHLTVKLQHVVPSVLVDSEVIETFALSSALALHPGNVTLHVYYKVRKRISGRVLIIRQILF